MQLSASIPVPRPAAEIALGGKPSHPVGLLFDLFNHLDAEHLDLLDTVYTPDVVFIDPAHEAHGLPALKAHMARLYEGVQECRFQQEGGVQGATESTVVWRMQLRHPRLAGGRPIEVPGITHLRHGGLGGRAGGLIHYHRDYFDLGALLYEQVPLLGGVVRALKRRLGGSE